MKNIIVILFIALFINSCKPTKENLETKIQLSFSHHVNGSQLSTDSMIHTNAAGEKFNVKTLTYKDQYEISKKITVLSSITPKLYTYRILEEYPHDTNAYTQGLEFKNDTLYESTGQYKNSSLRKTNYKTGEIYTKISLDDAYFGEGLTILNEKIYQLTWREKTGFIYDLNTLRKIGSFVYGRSSEGWGLCQDGESIYKSDGTQRIWRLNANTLNEEGFIEIYTNSSKIKSVNELEWVNGKIYANIYLRDAIAIVDPKNGAVEGVIDLTSLKNKVSVSNPKDEVLNGIAYNGEENTLYVTGKNWNKLFKIKIFEK